MNGSKMTIEKVGKRIKELHDVIGVTGKKNCSVIIRAILKSNPLVSAVMRNNVIVKNGSLYRWNMKYRLSIELATLVYNDYMNIRFKQETQGTTSKTNDSSGYVAINSLKNTKMSKWWYYEGVRTGKIPSMKINGIIHIPESYVKTQETPVQEKVSVKDAVDVEYFDRKLETLRAYATENVEDMKWSITLLKDRDNDIDNKLNNLNDELVTLRIQLQQLQKNEDYTKAQIEEYLHDMTNINIKLIDLKQLIQFNPKVGLLRKFWRWLW